MVFPNPKKYIVAENKNTPEQPKSTEVLKLEETIAGLQKQLEAETTAHAATLAKLEEAEKEVASLKSQVQTVIEVKAEEPKKPEVIQEPFTYKGKKYQLLVAQVHIPGIGLRTAAEIVLDEEDTDGVKKFLVESESGVIKPVV